MAPKPIPKLSDQIREAVKASGVSAYRICVDTGLDKGALSRFVSGERGLTLESIDTLAAYLELKIAAPKRQKSA